MSDIKKQACFEAHDIWAAFSMLTRLKVPVDHKRAGERANAATWAFPIIGAIIGGLAGFVLMVANALMLPTSLSAALALLTLIALTGAMHEDGLADCADGFWGGHTHERRLEIMKDSSIGAYGAVILIVFLLAEWSAIETLAHSNSVLTLAGVGSISRLPMIIALRVIPNARETGLAANVGIPQLCSIQIACGLTVLISFLCLGIFGLMITIIGILFALPVFFIAKAKIGGQTGDVLGASQKCAELGTLAAALIF